MTNPRQSPCGMPLGTAYVLPSCVEKAWSRNLSGNRSMGFMPLRCFRLRFMKEWRTAAAVPLNKCKSRFMEGGRMRKFAVLLYPDFSLQGER